jgi:glycosyltransferase involved in cell wall biosynthesis
MNVARISVIIPLYNKAPYIAAAVRSVLAQTVTDFEIIVVDDGSSDDGAEIVKRFNDPRLRLVRQENQGESAARNKGVKLAASGLMAFLDADDEWTPSHIEVLLRLAGRFPEAGMLATAYKIVTPDGTSRLAGYRGIPAAPWEGLLPNFFLSLARGVTSELLGEYPVNASVAGIPKKVLLEAGEFPDGYWYGADIDLFGRIALKYPVAFSWEGLGIYHRDALGRCCERTRPLDYVEPFIKTAREAMTRGEVRPEFVGPLNEFLSLKEIPRAAENLVAGNRDTARAILRACKTRWLLGRKLKWTVLAAMPFPLFRFLRTQNLRLRGRKAN